MSACEINLTIRIVSEDEPSRISALGYVMG